ncbi:hypothetical protein A2780_03890 [Candidatus Daviesbacteria bacterium RIFCSPHIGHO2_01_FULL_41_45]|uniref:Phosphoribulokinase/uridine kinase domain-containing protein n=2 Tax=Candidatus Yanofskyibacteriota TaxID=1752733 RepID=A0A1F8G056_9BACT|nr:MAG: hypothetical protein A2780_03890 [Candidatus Daviesbacteria bacterium RIFCSPHIGHO2_01_FULL_41_45]OGN18755.1 MAG: hypothetical protein A3F25_03040 [Candidatus Yanofskybacteria bacterium RIFCSPHIGHO2_12_FULL_45_19b]OGN32963.1 MAG: hypothetical protein A3I32_01445 [Candidatus Yanofskybacteria bacterium RIFCSPLOWO2_02_FULL_45_10]
MTIQEAVQQINFKLEEWGSSTNKLVVGIDGYTGVGKTTVLNQLAILNENILAVNQDDFLLSREATKNLLAKAKDRSQVFELENRDSKKIEDLVSAFRNGAEIYEMKVFNPVSGEIDILKSFNLSKKILVIEGVFMFHPKSLDHLWGRRIYLDGNIEEIDARRVKREKERWGKDYFPETRPDSYFRQVIIALRRYKDMYNPEELADLVLTI